jgi:hypothetical protein
VVNHFPGRIVGKRSKNVLCFKRAALLVPSLEGTLSSTSTPPLALHTPHSRREKPRARGDGALLSSSSGEIARVVATDEGGVLGEGRDDAVGATEAWCHRGG